MGSLISLSVLFGSKVFEVVGSDGRLFNLYIFNFILFFFLSTSDKKVGSFIHSFVIYRLNRDGIRHTFVTILIYGRQSRVSVGTFL